MACFLSGFGIAYYKGADFAGICTAFLPLLLLALALFSGKVRRATVAKVNVVKRLGGVVEESLGAIRLIASFANEEKEIKKFDKLADEARNVAHH